MEYTKGEWKANYTGSKLVSVDCSSRAEVVAICGKNKWIKTRDEQIANAHLIASAPDMYEALKELSNYHPKQGYEQWLILLNKAQQAIAKAEGK